MGKKSNGKIMEEKNVDFTRFFDFLRIFLTQQTNVLEIIKGCKNH